MLSDQLEIRPVAVAEAWPACPLWRALRLLSSQSAGERRDGARLLGSLLADSPFSTARRQRLVQRPQRQVPGRRTASHSRAAATLSRDSFNSDVVLRRLLNEVGA